VRQNEGKKGGKGKARERQGKGKGKARERQGKGKGKIEIKFPARK
jgi:hypothetical protein